MAELLFSNNYPGTILESFVKWSDTVFLSPPSKKYQTPTGFQEITNSSGASNRTRATEIYRTGVLRGPVVGSPPKGKLPLGWDLLTNNQNLHTAFGYLAYILSKASKLGNNEAINGGLSAVYALMSAQIWIRSDNGALFSFVAFFEWLKTKFPKPNGVGKNTWLRYLATGAFSSLNDGIAGEALILDFLSSVHTSPILKFIWLSKEVELDADDFQSFIIREENITQVIPYKPSLYWIGKDDYTKGLYSIATRNCAAFMEEFGAAERKLLVEGGNAGNEIFWPMYEKIPQQETQDIFEILKGFEAIDPLKIPILNLMKTLKEGAVEAVQILFNEDIPLKISVRSASLPKNLPFQKILFGPPGTGKSHEAEKVTKGFSVKRTTFHPDADYASFVGSYKPVSNEKGKISYEFRPQVFAEAYLEAWSDLNKPQFLLIEEINRGNCAQIFGDLFQSLDRNENGDSRYEARADADFAKWLQTKLAINAPALAAYEAAMASRGLDGLDWIVLPNNLYIWATMNTSDQSLYPMDSAFKRRWDWQYIPIDLVDARGMTIDLGTSGKYNWADFIEKVNERIYTLLESEDKQLGNRFVDPKTEPRVVNTTDFKAKVLFYLWSEIYKLETESGKSIFLYQPGGEGSDKVLFTFADLYKPGADKLILRSFMANLGLTPEEGPSEPADVSSETTSTDTDFPASSDDDTSADSEKSSDDEDEDL